MNCRDFEEIAGLYLDDELSVETSNAALHHLEVCPNCRQDLIEQRKFNQHFKLAIWENPANQIDQSKINELISRAHIQAVSSNSYLDLFRQYFTIKILIPATGLLVIIVGVFSFLQFYTLNSPNINVIEETTPKNSNANPNGLQTDETIQTTKIAWRELMTNAVTEHESCTLNNLRSEHNNVTNRNNISSPAKDSLEGIVQTALQKSITKPVIFAESHNCDSKGKSYRHLMYKDGKSFISVLIANSEGLNGTDEAMYCESKNNYQVACFTSLNQTIFVISEMTESENLKLARSISSGVRQYLEESKSNL